MPCMCVEGDENGAEHQYAVGSVRVRARLSALGWRIQPTPEKEITPGDAEAARERRDDHSDLL